MDAPFDRGEVDRASLDATERLRARLSGRPAPAPQPRQRRILPWVIAGGLFVFSIGMIANPWFERSIRTNLPFVTAQADDPAVTDAALTERLNRLEKRTVAAPMPSERLARTEARMETSSDQLVREAERVDKLTAQVATLSATLAADKARSETATATATAAADRAQAMLVLVLVRRAIDAGRPLGPLEPLLRQSFDPRYPQAVQSLSALGAAPVTPASLRRDFDAMRPAIGAPAATGTRQDWWQTLKSTVGNAVSRPTEASQAPAEAAASALARGDVTAAAGHLRRILGPRAAALTNWLAAADRLLAANAALATLETATILAPPAPAAPPTKAPTTASP